MSVPLDVSAEHAPLIRKLESLVALSPGDRAAIAGLPLTILDVPEDADLAREGDRPQDSILVLDGFVCRYKVLQEGQRQILSFHMTGDMPDLQSIFLSVMDHNIGALTPARVALVPHDALLELIRTLPGVTAALWKVTLADAAIFRAWLTGVGRRSAKGRIAHLLCETYVRLKAVDLIDGKPLFELPVTQAELADALGLSTVHVNRVIQELRREGLIASRGRHWEIKDGAGLRQVAEWNGAYLHLRVPIPEWT